MHTVLTIDTKNVDLDHKACMPLNHLLKKKTKKLLHIAFVIDTT